VEAVAHAQRAESDLLELIVGRKLSCVDDCVSGNVGAPSYPKSGNTVLSEDLLVGIERARVGALSYGESALRLHADFNYISRVGERDCNTSRSHTGSDLLEQSRVLTGFHRTTK
jgi:hypothetical protein